MSENKILEELERSSKQAAIPFGIAIMFMGFAFSPLVYNVKYNWVISIIFILLGIWVMSSAFWPMKKNRFGGFIRYLITMLVGIGIGIALGRLFFVST